MAVIDYLRANDESDKQESKKQAATLLNQIYHIKSLNIDKEIIDQLESTSYLNQFYKQLIMLYPKETTELRNSAYPKHLPARLTLNIFLPVVKIIK